MLDLGRLLQVRRGLSKVLAEGLLLRLGLPLLLLVPIVLDRGTEALAPALENGLPSLSLEAHLLGAFDSLEPLQEALLPPLRPWPALQRPR